MSRNSIPSALVVNGLKSLRHTRCRRVAAARRSASSSAEREACEVLLPILRRVEPAGLDAIGREDGGMGKGDAWTVRGKWVFPVCRIEYIALSAVDNEKGAYTTKGRE